MTREEAIEIICDDYCKFPDIESGNRLADICDSCPFNKCEDLRWADRKTEQTERSRTMTRQDAIWHANHVFNLVIERCINAQNLKDAREFDEAKQIVIEALEYEPKAGKWEDKGDYYVCSECGERMPYSVFSGGSRAYAYMSEYCPRCGARMESEQ